MRDLVVDLADHGHAVLLSSHMLAEVQEVCDRVGVISHGRLVAESTVADLRGDSRLASEPSLSMRRTVLALLVSPAALGRDGDLLLVDIDEERTPGLVRALVGAGIELHELTRREQSLEDVFFRMTTDAHEQS